MGQEIEMEHMVSPNNQLIEELAKKSNMIDGKSDFGGYLRILVEFFAITKNVDSAGMFIHPIFGLDDQQIPDSEFKGSKLPLGTEKGLKQRADMRISFSQWVLNLDIYGSFEPYSYESMDL